MTYLSRSNMRHWLFVFFCFLALEGWAGSGDQQAIPFEGEEGENPIHIELIAEENSIQAARPFWVMINMAIKPHWHTYWKNPGETGAPISIEWTLPAGFQVANIEWPYPQRFELNSILGFGYENQVSFLVELIPPKTVPSDAIFGLQAAVKWVVCSDAECVPGEQIVSTSIGAGTASPVSNPAYKTIFQNARAKLPQKMEEIHVERKDNQVQFAFSSAGLSQDLLSEAYFCPEPSSSIGHRTLPVISQDVDSSLMKVTLAEEGAVADRLKGVLVLKSDELLALAIDAPIHDFTPRVDLPKIDEHSYDVQDFKGGIALALVFAFLGGLILNLMPCVLPVISLKILSFVKMAGQDRLLIFKHGLFFALGVVLSFWALAGFLLVLRAYGETVGWGFQLQEPIFVAFLGGVLLLLTLNLFGVFEMGMAVTAWAGQAESNHHNKGLVSSFLSGVLATAVATPCSGPFLGSAVGFAVTLPASAALLIFTVLGLGMAFPYLLLSCFPGLLRFVPKPGNWMITFKEIMGFFMLATVIWLVWVFNAQTSALSMLFLLMGFFCISLSAWIYGKWGVSIRFSAVGWVAKGAALGVIATGGYLLWMAALQPDSKNTSSFSSEIASGDWEPFSPERVEELRRKGIPVLIDFTAKWCLICQANHLVLSSSSVEEKFNELGVVRMKADWTKNDPIITKELRKFGRSSVPLYVFYGNGDDAGPEILPQVLTPDYVLNILKKLETGSVANVD